MHKLYAVVSTYINQYIHICGRVINYKQTHTHTCTRFCCIHIIGLNITTSNGKKKDEIDEY